MSEDERGIVYVLTNPAMPGLVKIGKTARKDVRTRLAELYTTGVPVPFECAFAARVPDPAKVELAFHRAFTQQRRNASREFFLIEPEQAVALLELLDYEDVTPEVAAEASQVDPASKSAGEQLKRRNRPRLDFLEMGIGVDSELIFKDGAETCRVVANRKVEYKGETMSLTPLTMQLLGAPRAVSPTPYWSFEGRNLNEIYNETYADAEDE